MLGLQGPYFVIIICCNFAAIVLCVQAVRSVDDVNMIYRLMAIGSRYLSHVMAVLGSICVLRKY